MSDEPKKAYYVEVLSRSVKTGLVFADSAEDAKRRYCDQGGHDDTFDSYARPAGFKRVVRSPEDDRHV